MRWWKIYGVKPGNRVLIRSGNNPALVAAWLAPLKPEPSSSNTMPMLRAVELTKIVDKAEIALRADRQPHRRRTGRLRQDQPVSQAGREFRRNVEP